MAIIWTPILAFSRAMLIPAQPALITSRQYFRKAGLETSMMGPNFKAQFLDLEVPPAKKEELVIRKLMDASLDISILAEIENLGEEAIISVSQFRVFLARNQNSRKQFLFYLRGKNGEVWSVEANWRGFISGWDVYPDSVNQHRRKHSGGHQVVTHASK